MNITLANGAVLTPISAVGGKRNVNGVYREVLTFAFPETENMANIDNLFSDENCETITIQDETGEYIHDGYTIRAELSKAPIEVEPETESTPSVIENRITVSMAQRTYMEGQIAGLITSYPNTIEGKKAKRVSESKKDLEAYLANNPMTWIDGNQYNVTAEKQSLLTSQLALYQTAAAAGKPYELKWNTTGGECTVWEYENMVALALAIGQYVQPLVSYQQEKEVEIMSCETVEDLDAIVIDYATLA